MTTATAAEVERRKRGAPRKPRTVAALASTLFAAAALAAGVGASAAEEPTWPSPKYQADPVAFGREVLGVEPWAKQVEILQTVRDHDRVAIAAGHKVSKSHTAAWIAFWYYCSFPDARVVMSSTTARQVDQILWREARMMHARAGRCVDCKRRDEQLRAERKAPGPVPCPHSAFIGGEPSVLARSGLKADDFREITGFTAREAEAVAGVSGKNLLYIVDEASGVEDVIFEAIEGNRAGGARIVLFSNPTQTSGEFFEAFHGKSKFYKTVSISSEDSPNVIEGRDIIPGLATRSWVEEKRQEWGAESALFKIRVKGQFVLNEQGRIMSVHAIAEAEKRWEGTAAEGRLQIGLDPAGPAAGGDETAMAARRGQKVLEVLAWSGLTQEAILVNLLGALQKHRVTGEVPAVLVDREGPVGWEAYKHLREYAEKNPGAFSVVGVRSSDAPRRQPNEYGRHRDELWANAAQWLREGGAVPEDTKLAKELHAPRWTSDLKGRLKATGKDDLRKDLGRSPDRADAVVLACWELGETPDVREAGTPQAPQGTEPAAQGIDPYGAMRAWGRR